MKPSRLTPIFSLLLALPAGSLCAQELNESMTVQGAYDPVIRHHERISSLPARLSLPLPEASLPLATAAEPLSPEARLAPVGAPLSGNTLPPSRRGYIDLYAGSMLNTSLSAGYKAIANTSTTLGVWLQHNSSSLYRPSAGSPYRRRYDEMLGARLTHILAPGTLSVDAAYHLGYFNYYRAANPAVSDRQPIPGSQTLNDLRVAAAWKGAQPVEGLDYSAALTYNYFGFRRMYYLAPEPLHTYAAARPARENDIKLSGAVSYTFGHSAVSLEAQSRWLPYAHSELHTPGFYTIKPAYTLTTQAVSLRAGVRLDLTHSIEGLTKFACAHVAPDIAVNLTSGGFIASLTATGGVQPNTLAALHQLDYYAAPTIESTTPLYTPVNARLRLGFANICGFSGGVSAGYASMHNTPLAGTYPLYLFGLPGTPSARLATPGLLNIHGFTLGADLHFSLSRLIDVDAELSYSPQHGSRGSFNGIDRPRWVIDTKATVRPVAPLAVTVGYDYRGVRNLYYRTAVSGPLSSLRLPDMYDLHAEAAYTFAGRYTIGLLARNILSSNPWTTPDMPLEGFTLLGRFAVVF